MKGNGKTLAAVTAVMALIVLAFWLLRKRSGVSSVRVTTTDGAEVQQECRYQGSNGSKKVLNILSSRTCPPSFIQGEVVYTLIMADRPQPSPESIGF